MYFLRYYFFATFILISIISSCEFSPSDVNPVEVERIDSAYFEIKLSEDHDTISIVATTYIDYELLLGEKSLHDVEIFIDDKSQKGNYGANSSIRVNPEDFGSGYYPLRITIVTNTKSGSLADIIGQEVFIAEFEFTLHIDIDPPDPLRIIDFSNEDGILAITWEKYDRINFKRYELHKYGSADRSPYQGELISVISDPNITTVYDNSYVGGKAYYRLFVVASQGDYAIGEIQETDDDFSRFVGFYQVDLPDSIPDKVYEISWNKTAYPQGLKNYRVYTTNAQYLSVEISDPAVGQLRLFDFPFGFAYDFIIACEPNNYLFGKTQDALLSCYIGEKVNQVIRATYNPHNRSTYYGAGQNTLTIIKEDGSESTHIGQNFHLSNVTAADIYVPSANVIDVYDNMDCNLKSSITSEQVEEGSQFSSKISVSDNGILLTYMSRSIYVYNVNTNTVLGKFKADYWVQGNYHVAPDGKHVFINDILYEIANDQLIERLELDINNDFYSDFANSDEFFTIDFNQYPAVIQFYNLSDYQLTSELTVNATNVSGKKVPLVGKILVYEETSRDLRDLYLVDLIEKTVSKSYAVYDTNYYLLDDDLLSAEGYSIKLEDL